MPESLPDRPDPAVIQQWIDALQGGDEDARTRLLDCAYDRLLVMARGKLTGFMPLREVLQSDDVRQEAAIRIWHALKDMHPRTIPEFMGLAACAIRRALIDLVRERCGRDGSGKRRHTEESLPGIANEPADSEQDLAQEARWADFHEAVAGLPDKERQVFDLCCYHGLTQPEAAQQLDVGLNTVKRRWQSIRRITPRRTVMTMAAQLAQGLWLSFVVARRRVAAGTAVLVSGVLVCAATAVLAQVTDLPLVGFKSASATVERTAGTYDIIVSLSAAQTKTITVQYAVTGGSAVSPQDYTIPAGSSGTLTFPAGTTDQTITVVITPNPVPHGDSTVVLSLSNPINANLDINTFTLTIQDTIPTSATVAFDYSPYEEVESNGVAWISVTMTGTPTGPVSVNYSTSDGTANSDPKKGAVNYLPASGTLTWAPTEAGTSKWFTIVLVDDGNVDLTLTVNLTLSSPVNASLGSPSTAVLNILDADTICPP